MQRTKFTCDGAHRHDLCGSPADLSKKGTMGHRQFSDSAGVAWEVWDVQPAVLTPASSSSPDATVPSSGSPAGSPRWESPRLDGPLANGWLCFQCAGAKRRLAPIPDGWQELDGVQLERLCVSASAVVARGSMAFSATELLRTPSPMDARGP
jgi:hypothetical protein